MNSESEKLKQRANLQAKIINNENDGNEINTQSKVNNLDSERKIENQKDLTGSSIIRELNEKKKKIVEGKKRLIDENFNNYGQKNWLFIITIILFIIVTIAFLIYYFTV